MWVKDAQHIHDDGMWMIWEEKEKKISGEERTWKHHKEFSQRVLL